jgi:hypothetical protein
MTLQLRRFAGLRTCRVWLILCLFSPALQAALQWEQGPGFRRAALVVPAGGKAGFTLMPPNQTGINFSNVLSDDKAAENQIRLLGSGVALGDVDGDGWCDIYLARLEGDNVLYRNLGDWKFQDITAAAGVACPGQFSTGAALVDVDGDGDLDLLVNSIGGGTRLFLNDGHGHFAESLESGLIRRFCATSMALADVDGDGDLDLYVANYRTTTVRSTGMTILNMNGKRVLRPEDREDYEITPEGLILEHGEVDVLYLNDGKGHFSPVSWTGGAFLDEQGVRLKKPPRDWGLSVMIRDLNGDGAPDIYICNDFWSPDRIWWGDGKGHFRAAPSSAFRHTATFSMGIDVADINRDGLDDIFVLDMLSRDHARRMRQRSMAGQSRSDPQTLEARPQVGHNTLFLNQGNGAFAEIAQLARLDASEWSWGAVFMDVDLDGFEDLLVTNGHFVDPQDIDAEARIAGMGPRPKSEFGRTLLLYPRLDLANLAFRNRGDLTFEEVGQAWGFNAVGVSHGIALADLDNDGDLDAVVNNLNAPVGLYRNNSSSPRLAVRLKGSPSNTRAIGATIQLQGGAVTQSQTLIAGGRYLSSDDPERVFAARGQQFNLTVIWPDGKRSLISNALPNSIYEVEHSGAIVSRALAGISSPPFFREVTNFNHVHKDLPFDDFQRQPLLTRSLSALGPGLAWCDLDGDGFEDLLITGGHGSELTILKNQDGSNWTALLPQPSLKATNDDQTAVLAFPIGPGELRLLVGVANYESGSGGGVAQFARTNGSWTALAGVASGIGSIGPIAVADIDGDGDLDLFAGGRCVAGRYPEAAASQLYLNENGSFKLAHEWPRLGLVSSCVFSDLDNDGFPELIVACDWGAIRVFQNDHGRFQEVTTNFGLDRFVGWWNGVTTGDFDGDGKLDIVAANWGRNSAFESWSGRELRNYFGDLSGNGSTDGVESFWDSSNNREVPWRSLDVLAEAIPALRERFPFAAAYGAAGLDEILGPRKKSLQVLRANWLQSTLFLNRSGSFEVHPLPLQAQYAPAFALCVGDFNGDGHEDLFLSQNFFHYADELSRDDAGAALWLQGDGHGAFNVLSTAQSGIQVLGEQRGAALCDFDHDGRIDVSVTQHNASTRIFRNEMGRPCLRIRLRGPDRNPTGIGAILRLKKGTSFGPAREIHAGAGYWSQDSAVQLFGGENLNAIEVLWPGGTRKTSELPAGAREIEVDISGAVKVVR